MPYLVHGPPTRIFAHFRQVAAAKQKSYYAVFPLGLTIGYEHLPSSEPRFANELQSACGQSRPGPC